VTNAADGTAPPPGWYPDPYGSGVLRWWDGIRWSEQLAPAPYPGASSGAPYVTPERRQLSPDTPVYTVWIWLVALLPLLVGIELFFIHPQLGFRLTADGSPVINRDPFAMLGGPIYFVVIAFSWLLQAAVVVSAWLDYRELVRRGVDRPFHWAWAFLATVVYPIGRTVIVRRVAGGRGAAPMWVSIAVAAVTIVLATIWSVMLVTQMLNTVIQNLPAGT
jgi:hypothetical protein